MPLRDIGIKADKDFDVSGFANQSAYTPVIQEMKNSGSNYGQATTYQATVLLRKEATLQGLTGVKVWDCGVGCYDKQFLSTGGSDVNGEYVDTLFLPFYDKKEQKANPMTGNFVKYTGADKAASFGAYAWAAGHRLPRRGERPGEGRWRQQRDPQDDLRAAQQDPQVRRRGHVRAHRPRRTSGSRTAASPCR